jgi:beta-phosphoglucomutase family hydrolase
MCAKLRIGAEERGNREFPATFSTMSTPAFAALFDWDGVVLDSSSQHERSWELLAAETGLPLPKGHFKRSFGMKNEAILPDILEWTRDPAEIRRLSLRKEELYREIIRAEGIEPLPGVRTWLECLQAAGIPCVIGSSTHRKNIDTCLIAFGFTEFFTGIVTAEDVNKGKPEPDVFLKAAEKAKMEPARCVVFEDAPVGIEAGLRAGMRVIGVAGTHPRETLMGSQGKPGPHRIVARLDELTVESVLELFIPHRTLESKESA